MNDELENQLIKVKAKIFESEVIKEYLKLKKYINENEEIIVLKKEIEETKSSLHKSVDNHDEFLKNKGKLEVLSKKYNSHPIISNYNEIKKEVLDLLNQIKEILE